MTVQHTHALDLLAVLSKRVLADQPPINGYQYAAEAIGLDGADYARHMGQVCSRTDVATFYAGYPMLATHMVRKPNGEIASTAFGGIWNQFEKECIALATSHRWTPQQLDEVLGALNNLDAVGARRMWDKIRDHEALNPGYIRGILHHKVAKELR
jgi:hypothetical protein